MNLKILLTMMNFKITKIIKINALVYQIECIVNNIFFKSEGYFTKDFICNTYKLSSNDFNKLVKT